MKKLICVITILLLIACEETEYPVIYPERYFPAYPESFWVYSNGKTLKVDPGYHKHQYYPEIGSVKTTDFVLVPRIENQYVYKYSITQNNPQVPLRTFLKEGSPTSWIVDTWFGENVYRKIEKFNTLDTLYFDNQQTIIDSVITVVEYIGQENENRWIYRESFAPNIGLIRREINIGYDSVIPHTEMVLMRYFINK